MIVLDLKIITKVFILSKITCYYRNIIAIN